MIQNKKIFIHVKGVGFTILTNKRMKHNLISPAFMAFFNLGERQLYSPLENNIREVNTNPVYDKLQPFLPDYVNSISTKDMFHYVGKKIGICRNKRLRFYKVFLFKFEYEGHTFSFPFLLDKNLGVPAILGRESLNHIIETVMKQK